MLINVSIACIQDPNTGRSECSLLTESLQEYRSYIAENALVYGSQTLPLINQINDISQSIHDAMLKALEELEPLTVSDGKGGFKTMYDERKAIATEQKINQPEAINRNITGTGEGTSV